MLNRLLFERKEMTHLFRKELFIILAGMLVFCGCGASSGGKISEGRSGTESDEIIEETMQSYKPDLPVGTETADIFVQKIDGLSEDFIMGMDISSVLSEEASGVKYYDENGNEADLFMILADAGINCVRVRVWLDPYDSDGHGYGGGNCTTETAVEIGKRAAAYGMKLCVDYHYSDFWADPNKQMVPKAWKDMDLDAKVSALSDYTEDSLKTIIDSGADVCMVQVGNEINNAMSGEKGLNNKLKLVKAGCNAVHKVAADTGRDIKAVLHYTQIDDKKNIMEIARQLNAAKVDYDVFGVSYYPYWHGSMENMQDVLTEITATYGKSTCVMETAYPYTTEDGDGTGNSVDGTSLKNVYPVSVQGQANAIRDVMAYAADGGAVGAFYWEGAWIPVGNDLDSNQKIWEENGSGWASSFATEYDPDDAGKYYGGSSWDNQAMFDFEGKKLPSLNVFKYVRYGAIGPKTEITTDLNAPDAISVEVSIGGNIIMPEEIPVVYNDMSVTAPLIATWNTDDVSTIDTSVPGSYVIEGTGKSEALPGEELPLSATVNVSNINYVVNAGFEDDKVGSPWNSSSESGSAPVDIQDKEADAHEGTKAFHYYKAGDFSFHMWQTIEDIPAGTYELTSYIQGGDMGKDEEIYMFVLVGDQELHADCDSLSGWQQWKELRIEDISVADGDIVTIGYEVKGSGGGWGTIDDFNLSLMTE